MVLVSISLMISDAEHLFICLLAICLSLEKRLFESFAHFLIVIFTLLLDCRSSLPINLLPDTWFVNIFYFCLFTVDSSAAQKFLSSM